MIRRLGLFYEARDLARTGELLEAALGAEFTPERHLEETTYFATGLAGGAVLELWPTSGKAVSRVQLEFAVPDLGAAAERLTAAGFEVRRVVGAVLVIDRAGNTVALTVEGPKGNR